ncbi:MAG: endoribonuclease MazF [Dehalococcoidia bacterium]
MVKTHKYVPEKGDIIWISFNPQSGHEQSGRRPALVLSPKSYNEKVGLATLCPITSQVKGYPFEVTIPEDLPVTGVVLSDQAKNLDWRTREAEYACDVPDHTYADVVKRLVSLIYQV